MYKFFRNGNVKAAKGLNIINDNNNAPLRVFHDASPKLSKRGDKIRVEGR